MIRKKHFLTRFAAVLCVSISLLFASCASSAVSDSVETTELEKNALLSARLSSHGYSEAQIALLFKELRFFEITPLLVFDTQSDLSSYIEDCHAHSEVNSPSHFELSGHYNTYFDRAESVSDLTDPAMLVNKNHCLPADYVPALIQTIPDEYHLDDDDTYELAGVAAESLIEWAKASMQADAGFILESAYRSYTRQQEVYDYYLKKYEGDKAKVESICARPGFSEHQTGYVADLRSVDKTEENKLLYKDSKAFVFTQATCADYGWILRYPEGKECITGYSYESWHYRYVGKELAHAVQKSGLTYDEYYCLYLAK